MNIGALDLLLTVNDDQFDAQLQSAVNRAKKAIGSIPDVKLTVDDSDVQRAVKQANRALSGIKSPAIKPTLDTGPATKQIAALQAQLQQLKATGQKLVMGGGGGSRTDDMQRRGYHSLVTGGALTASVTAPVLGLGALSLKSAGDFEESMNRLATLTNVSRESIGALRKEILALADDKRIRQTPEQLGEGMYFVASTVDDATQAMAALRASALGASAGLGDTQTVAKVVTTSMDAYGIAATDATQITDKLIAAIKTGKAEGSEFAQSLGKVAGTAKIAGVGLDETLASLSAMSRLISTDEAATSLNNLILKIVRPSAQARAEMKAIGTSAAQLQKELRTIGLQKTLQGLVEKTGGNPESLSRLFPEIRAFRGLLATAGVQNATYVKTLDDVATSAGETAKAAEQSSVTFNASMDRLKKVAQETAIVLGDRFLPRVADTADAVGNKLPAALDTALGIWDKLPEPIQKAAAMLGAFALAAGPLKMVLGNVGMMGSAVGSFFGPLAATPAIAGALAPIAAFAANPYVLALLGGAVVVGGVVGWNKLSEAIAETEKRTLRFAQVPPPQIQRNHESD